MNIRIKTDIYFNSILSSKIDFTNEFNKLCNRVKNNDINIDWYIIDQFSSWINDSQYQYRVHIDMIINLYIKEKYHKFKNQFNPNYKIDLNNIDSFSYYFYMLFLVNEYIVPFYYENTYVNDSKIKEQYLYDTKLTDQEIEYLFKQLMSDEYQQIQNQYYSESNIIYEPIINDILEQYSMPLCKNSNIIGRKHMIALLK